MSFLLYILKVSLCSGILYGYYHLFLRNKRFHHYNRFYLLGALVLSMVLPLIKIPVFNEDAGTLNQVVYQTVRVVTLPQQAPSLPAQPTTILFTLSSLVWVLYGAGILVLLIILGRSLWYIRKISRRYPFEVVDKLKFYQTQEPGTPFSFFRSIFWNDALNVDSQQGQQVFRHELFHVQQKHSADLLLAALVTMLGWFNPFFHLIKKELKAIHEFLADQYAASGSNRYQYAELLVQQVMINRKLSITHYFFQNQLKRRIAMITQLNQSKYGYWSRVMVLPVSVILFLSVALYAGENKKTNTTQHEKHVLANKGIVPAAADTIPKQEREIQAMVEQKIKAEKQAVEEKQRQFLYDEKRFKERELGIIRDRQLVLQKMLQENKTKDIKVNGAIQKELYALKLQEKVLRELIMNSDNNNDQHFNYQEEWTLENEKNQLLVEKKELALRTDAETAKRLEEIELQQEAVEVARKEELAAVREKELTLRQSFHYSDTVLTALTRFFNRNFRYPLEMMNNDGEGSIWYSFLLDENGKLRDFEIYNEAPATTQGSTQVLVIVGYPKQPPTSKKSLTPESKQEVMKKEVLRIAEKGHPVPGIGKVTPARYYWKATFKLER